MKKTSLKSKPIFIATCTFVLILFSLPLNAHIITEEPWHSVPGAYLRGLFYASLKPINWELIAKEYETPIDIPGYERKTVYDLLAPASTVGNVDHVAAIRKAIADKDPEALYIASTKAICQLTRYYVAQAKSKLDKPGAALEDVLTARRIYRAFERFIEEIDPTGYKEMGHAWLIMTSSVGSAGVVGVGGKAPDREKFSVARKMMEDYMIANYETDGLRKHAVLAPIPQNSPTANRNAKLTPWLPPGTDINDQDPLPRLVLNFESRGIDEKDLFLVAYGDMLFDSAEMMGEPARSIGIACATCHNRSDINQRFFIPGITSKPGAVDIDGHFFNPRFNDHRNDALDIPSLRGLRFTAPYGRDGRFASLRDFVRNVIVNEFSGDEPTPLMLDALVTYMLEFDWLPSTYLNPDGTLNERASEPAKRGEVVFNKPFQGMGNRACSTCHIPSANFMDGLRHDIGSGKPSIPRARDTFFDTPTLINIQYTAPYFHDGSLDTLSDVVDWFNERYKLGLTKKEKADLTAYLDAVGTGEEPYQVFDDENTQFLLDWAELSTFVSTLSTLLPAKDKYHTKVLIRTVSTDMRLDASGLKDISQAPKVYELANKLDEILDAAEDNDWEKSTKLWMEYQTLEARYSPQFK